MGTMEKQDKLQVWVSKGVCPELQPAVL